MQLQVFEGHIGKHMALQSAQKPYAVVVPDHFLAELSRLIAIPRGKVYAIVDFVQLLRRVAG